MAEAAVVQLRPDTKIIPALDWFKKRMQSRGYSENTIATYTTLLETFLRWLDKPLREATEEDAVNFNSDFILTTGRSASYQRYS